MLVLGELAAFPGDGDEPVTGGLRGGAQRGHLVVGEFRVVPADDEAVFQVVDGTLDPQVGNALVKTVGVRQRAGIVVTR